MKQHQMGKTCQAFLFFAGLLTFFLVVSLACRLPGSNQMGSGEQLTSFVGAEGGTALGPGNVELIVPEGAFTQPTGITIEEVKTIPPFPEALEIDIAGKPAEITVSGQAEEGAVFELVMPFERADGVPNDQYTVLGWDGSRWTTAGGVVDGDTIRVWTSQFVTFLPARAGWMHRPVSFVNDGPYTATVMPWTYEPFDPINFLPPGLSTVSSAPGSPGLWPNPSRFLTLPLGLYTFCIEWDEDQDLDNDGYIDIYHDILEGPSDGIPFSVNENDSIDMAFAKEIRFRTDPIEKLPGRCPGVLGASQASISQGSPNPTATHPPTSGKVTGGQTPTPSMDTEVLQPTSTTAVAAATETAAPTKAPQLVWVLTEVQVNPNNEQLEFRGGPSIPGWFDEDRFEGTFLIYSVSETSFKIDNRFVDHGFESHNVTIQTSFEALPQTLTPDETIELVANFSHSGTVTEGIGNGILFWYSSNINIMEPDYAFGYSPWHPDFTGENTTTFSFVVPAISREGSEFEIYASVWNNAPCLVIWKYQAQ